jgi:ATP:corrinoid adenosyltransferase
LTKLRRAVVAPVAEQQHRTDQFGLAVEQGNGNGVVGVGQACRATTQCRNILGLQVAGTRDAIGERRAKQRAGGQGVDRWQCAAEVGSGIGQRRGRFQLRPVGQIKDAGTCLRCR